MDTGDGICIGSIIIGLVLLAIFKPIIIAVILIWVVATVLTSD